MWVDGEWAQITKVSNDKGPYKIATAQMHGNEVEITILEPYGVQGSPIKDGQVFVFPGSSDTGQMVGVCMPPPAKRTDQQKEGEVSYVNHATGNALKHDKDGNTTLKTKADHRINTDGIVYINC